MPHAPRIVPPTLLRYWLCRTSDHIRIAWGTPEHSAELTADGRVLIASADVPECLRFAARDCADALYHDIPGCEFQGVETAEEMHRQVAARCMSCGTVMPSENWLSRDGECGKCMCRSMVNVLAEAV